MATEVGVHYLVALGEHAGDMVKGALEGGLPAERAEIAESREDMANRIKDVMKEGDWILIKGSRGMAMEEVIEKLKGSSS